LGTGEWKEILCGGIKNLNWCGMLIMFRFLLDLKNSFKDDSKGSQSEGSNRCSNNRTV
jgi:hypothetical protein